MDRMDVFYPGEKGEHLVKDMMRFGGWTDGWKDGRVEMRRLEGWKDGRMEGWK